MSLPYHRQTPEQALEEQKVSLSGLSAQEASRREEAFGPNKLSEGKKKSILQVFLEQFKDLLVIILMAAACISAASGNVESTIVIFAVLILNAILGTVQYLKAEKSLESLKAMSSPTAKVMRDGVRVELPSAQVVPGDIVLLEAGTVDVGELARTAFILGMDTKTLCSEDCKGLCPRCGANLNEGLCGCKREIDPRLAALAKLLENK